MDAIIWSLNLALKLLGIAIGFMIFKEIIKHGTGTFRNIVETIGLGIQAICLKIRSALLKAIQKERGEQPTQDQEAEEEKHEAPVL